MKTDRTNRRKTSTRAKQRGQTMLFVLLALGIFLLGAAAFAVDLTNIWFHRQAAQGAADAACTAGAMDLLEMAQRGAGPSNPNFAPGFTPGSDFQCSGSASAVPCWYASKNGYTPGGGLTSGPSNEVEVTFPASVPGVSKVAGFNSPFMQVKVRDKVQTFFIGLINGQFSRAMEVDGIATCGVVAEPATVPILVLDPGNENSVGLSGAGEIKIFGGGTRGIQVNSSDDESAISGGKLIDLSKGGPNLTGSYLGVTGAEPMCCGFKPSAAFWDAATAPMPDPLAALQAPPRPGTTRAGPYVTGTKLNGCPDSSGCDEYAGGYYPSGITIGHNTAIFDPGVYYLDGGTGFNAAAQSCVRPSTAGGDGTLGTIFYFNGTGSVSFTAQSGKCMGVAPLPLSALQCPGGSMLPADPDLPAGGLAGNVLVAPCTGAYGDQLGGTEPGGRQRGILFFQNRSQKANAVWHGDGSSAAAGTMYFHQCVTSGTDIGFNCSPSAYKTQFDAGGNACSSSFVIGSIITDQIQFNGNPCIDMVLNSFPSNSVLKASLLK